MMGLMPRSAKNITPDEVFSETSPDVIFFGLPCLAIKTDACVRFLTTARRDAGAKMRGWTQGAYILPDSKMYGMEWQAYILEKREIFSLFL